MNCKQCNYPDVFETTRTVDVWYKGHIKHIALHVMKCYGCYSEFSTDEQIQNNRANIQEFYYRVDGEIGS